MLDSEAQRHCSAERFTEIDNPPDIDIGSAEHIRPRSTRIVGKPRFGGSSGVAAIAAVIGQQHIEPVRAKRSSQWRAITTMASVTAEHKHSGTGRRARSRDKPGTEA